MRASVTRTSRLRILNVAYPLLPVGPGSAGGAEQILYLLDRGLAERHIAFSLSLLPKDHR